MKLQKLGEELYVPENFSRFHHYYADPEGNKEYTGVTSVLGVIAKPALIQWAANEAIKHLQTNCPCDEDGTIKASVRDMEAAKSAHRKKKEDAAEKGTDLHALVEQYVGLWIAAEPLGSLYEQLFSHWHDSAIRPFIEWARKENIRFIASEKRLYSREKWIAGTCDLIFEKDGKRYIGDVKTYKKLWDRVPLIQCAAYALMNEEMGEPKTDGYCVFNLPKERAHNPEEDVLWSFDTVGDTEAFLSALRLYRYLNTK